MYLDLGSAFPLQPPPRSGFQRVEPASTARGEGRDGVSPRASIPEAQILLHRPGSSVEKESQSRHENADILFGLVRILTRGHFYCAQHGDTSFVLTGLMASSNCLKLRVDYP